ncbi:ferrous iron transport protein A [Asticcacaulis sp. AC402]|uniref:FeoA family protein n=1 Tax=Asticcacaulis sp. AC402 TaxID=1282361 RepID=UPI0003C3CD13|nr:ferrous iron transport protein A [Asticcacaulis sp. AC402]ESQ73497.1 iron transporter [Asticcacaulis sp. AC402]
MKLTTLKAFTPARVLAVSDTSEVDPIARRLRELGFVDGEPVQVVGRGPFGADPLLIQIGFTRFALRRSEADRITVELAA